MAKQLLLMAAACILLAAAAAAAAVPSAAVISANSTAAATPQQTAYDAVESYGFPRGILPTGVRHHSFERNGAFEVKLTSACRVSLDETYALRYDSLVSGSIREWFMSRLTGVALEVTRSVEATSTMRVNTIRRVDDNLRFQGDAGSKSFGVGKFSVSPRCTA